MLKYWRLLIIMRNKTEQVPVDVFRGGFFHSFPFQHKTEHNQRQYSTYMEYHASSLMFVIHFPQTEKVLLTLTKQNTLQDPSWTAHLVFTVAFNST